MRTWQQINSDMGANYRKRSNAFQLFMRRTVKLARLAHPETGGNECLCRNWGNAEAQRIWADGWQRWHRYSVASDSRYAALVSELRTVKASA